MQEYLNQCLESVCVQANSEIEIIIIDDGSTDMSPKICDKYAKIYPNTYVIHQENLGLVASRKVGVSLSNGQYITFVDSDDWVDNEWYAKASEYLHKYPVDILAYGCLKEYGEYSLKWENKVPSGMYAGSVLQDVKHKAIVAEESFSMWEILPHLWNKIIKADLLKKCLLHVNSEITFGEDAACVYPCLWLCHTFGIVSDLPYHYRIRNDSMSNVYSSINSKKLRLITDGMREAAYHDLKINQQIYLYNCFLHLLKDYASLQKEGMVLYPFSKVRNDDRIVVYGYGGFGNSIINYIKDTNCVQLCGVIDQQAGKYSTANIEVLYPNKIKNMKYDYIIIAILDEPTAQGVANNLVKFGVLSEKILYITRELICNV